MQKDSKCLLIFMVIPHSKMSLLMVLHITKTHNTMNSVDYSPFWSVNATKTSVSNNAVMSSKLKRRTVLDQFSSISLTFPTVTQYKVPLDSTEVEE